MTKKLSRDIGIIQYEDEISNMRKSKRITKYDKKTITCNIKIILKLYHMKIKPSNVRKM